jgi:GT2 family glycosyltransferase
MARGADLAASPVVTRVTLLMPNRDNDRVLDTVLDRLAVNTTYPDVELIVIDDGSVDGSREILRRWRRSGRFPRFEVIEKEGSGVMESLNLGLATATGSHVVQLDADASVETPGWVEAMLAFFERDERVGVTTAKVVMDNGLLHACGIDVLGPEGLRDRPAELEEPVGRRSWHYRVRHRPDGLRPDVEGRIAEVDSGLGCCMMLRREDVVALGGWDTGYAPVWFDDIDLCLGVRKLGRKAFCLPQIRVTHHVKQRGERVPMTPSRAGKAVGRRIARRLPHDVLLRAERRLDADLTSPDHGRAQRERLRGHYAYFRSKWGFDPLNPDQRAIEARWGGTELCWRTDAERRRAGEAIAST